MRQQREAIARPLGRAAHVRPSACSRAGQPQPVPFSLSLVAGATKGARSNGASRTGDFQHAQRILGNRVVQRLVVPAAPAPAPGSGSVPRHAAPPVTDIPVGPVTDARGPAKNDRLFKLTIAFVVILSWHAIFTKRSFLGCRLCLRPAVVDPPTSSSLLLFRCFRN